MTHVKKKKREFLVFVLGKIKSVSTSAAAPAPTGPRPGLNSSGARSPLIRWGGTLSPPEVRTSTDLPCALCWPTANNRGTTVFEHTCFKRLPVRPLGVGLLAAMQAHLFARWQTCITRRTLCFYEAWIRRDREEIKTNPRSHLVTHARGG